MSPGILPFLSHSNNFPSQVREERKVISQAGLLTSGSSYSLRLPALAPRDIHYMI